MLSPQQWRRLVRFAITGAFATAVHVLIAVGFLRHVAPAPALANGVAFIGATACSYAINTLWSFSRRPQAAQALRYIVVSVAGCLLAMAVSGAAEAFGLPYAIGIAFVVALVTPVTFTLHNLWTYRTA